MNSANNVDKTTVMKTAPGWKILWVSHDNIHPCENVVFRSNKSYMADGKVKL